MDQPGEPTMQPNVPGDDVAVRYSATFWAVVLLTGIGAGLGGIVLMALLRAVQHVSYGYGSGVFQTAVERASAGRRVVVLASAGAVVSLAWILLRRIVPHQTGLSESIWAKEGRMPLVGSLANAMIQIVSVGAGASLGREGAPKEAGAAIASKLSDVGGLSVSQRRLLVACGAGAGMAAVYNVPLGGALFALEVLLGSLSLPLVLPAMVTSFVATAVSWIALPNQATYDLPHYPVSLTQIGWACIFGPLAGVAAVGYVRLISWSSRHKPDGWRLFPSIVVVFTVLGCTSIFYPQLLGNGKDIAQQAFVDQVSVPLLAILMVLKPLATAVCQRSGASGGLFTPTLAFGALFGGLLGHAWAAVWPGAPVASYALIGAGAVLAAAMQAPISSVVFILELTHRGTTLMVPLLIAVVGAMLVARALDDRSIYTAPLRRDDLRRADSRWNWLGSRRI